MWVNNQQSCQLIIEWLSVTDTEQVKEPAQHREQQDTAQQNSNFYKTGKMMRAMDEKLMDE